MRTISILCLVLISTASVVSAQRSSIRRGPATAALSRAQTKEAEQHLADLGYWTGPIDGRFDPASRFALIAFQKWAGREVAGQLTDVELDAIRSSDRPTARETGYEHVEVDLERQVLMLVRADNSVRVLPVSTGTNKPFMEDGLESIAYTPRGRFVVYDKTFGWENGALGSVYYANYITGAVAIHGSNSVPNTPASHGCIRIPVFAAREVSRQLKVGTIVLVYDRVTFVSAKEWADNPKLKEGAMLNGAELDYMDYPDARKTKAGIEAMKKIRSKIIRAD